MRLKIERIHPAVPVMSKVIRFPLARVLLGTLFGVISVAIAQVAIHLLAALVSLHNPGIAILTMIIALLAVYFSYTLYIRLVEQRPVTELSRDGAVRELVTGILAGLGLVTAILGILWLLGYFHVTGANPWLVLIPAMVANIPSGFIQEILFRGILFRITEETLGTWIALAISSLLFGLLHILSAHATLLSTLSITLEAGILLAGAYMLTRRLWLAIAIHVAWDFAIDGIFGVGSSGISGASVSGLLQAKLVGPTLLTGGAAGIEASLLAVIVVSVVGAYLIWQAQRHGHLVKSPGISRRYPLEIERTVN